MRQPKAPGGGKCRVPTASGAALNYCHNCHAYGLIVKIVTIVMIVIHKWFLAIFMTTIQLSPNVIDHQCIYMLMHMVSSQMSCKLFHCHDHHCQLWPNVDIINADTRRVQTERSQRREGSPRTWWYCHHHDHHHHQLSSCIMYDDVYHISSS